MRNAKPSVSNNVPAVFQSRNFKALRNRRDAIPARLRKPGAFRRLTPILIILLGICISCTDATPAGVADKDDPVSQSRQQASEGWVVDLHYTPARGPAWELFYTLRNEAYEAQGQDHTSEAEFERKYERALRVIEIGYDTERRRLKPILERYCQSFYLAKYGPFASCIVADRPTLTKLEAPGVLPRYARWTSTPMKQVALSRSCNALRSLSPDYQNMDPGFTTNFSGNYFGANLRFGVHEYDLGCDEEDNSYIRPIRESHAALRNVGGIHYLNKPDPANEINEHAHGVVTAMVGYYEGERRIVPHAEFFVANPATKSCNHPSSVMVDLGFYSSLDWFVANDVRLVNFSSGRIIGNPASNCHTTSPHDVRVVDWFARRYDMFVTWAGGYPDDENNFCEHGNVCLAHNTICVTGSKDTDTENVGEPSDRSDDDPVDTCWEVNPFPESDREEPDVSSEFQYASYASPYDDHSVCNGSGTSFAAPKVLALAGLQLAYLSGNWRSCRISEWMRAQIKTWAGKHPVNGKTTAYHADHLEDPGDELSGWGIPTPNERVLAQQFGCETDVGTGRPCLPSDDGTCGGPWLEGSGDNPPSVPDPPPNQSGLQLSQGFQVFDGSIDRGQMLRLALAGSSCPFTAADEHYETAGQWYNDIPSVNMNLGVYAMGSGEWTWKSYSIFDSIEIFEFLAPRSDRYQVWAFAPENWDVCQYRSGAVSGWAYSDYDGEFLASAHYIE